MQALWARDKHTTMSASSAPMGVIGGGTMGVGIAYVFSAAGYSVTLIEPSRERRTALLEELKHAAAGAVSRGKFDAAEGQRLVAGIKLGETIDDLPNGLALAIETVPEQIELKHRVLAEIEARLPALLVSNTSAISIDELAAQEELAALRPEMDGNEVITHLDITPGRDVGEAMKFLMEVRLEDGLIGDRAVRARLDAWWRERRSEEHTSGLQSRSDLVCRLLLEKKKK